MKNNKLFFTIFVVVIIFLSFILPSFSKKGLIAKIGNKENITIDSFLLNNKGISKDDLLKLDDNYYSIINDESHIVSLSSNKIINSFDIVKDSSKFRDLVFKELRVKYPLFIVEGIIGSDYDTFKVEPDNIYISFKGDNYIYDVTLICKDYKELVSYNCVDDISDDLNILGLDPNKKTVALSFDDGPGIYTESVIDELNKFNMKATFFELGSMMQRYPDIVRKVKDSGFEIGSHGYSHKSFVKLKLDGTIEELNKTNEIYKNITGEDIKLVRPPYGAINSTIKEGINTVFVRWNVDSLDWKVKDERYVENIMSVLKDGDIILAHDIHKSTLDNLNTLLTRLYNEGFQVVSISELASLKGVNLENNNLYFHF